MADPLLETQGIRARRSARQRFGAQRGVRVYRPTYRYLRGDPAKPAEAQTERGELKKGAPKHCRRSPCARLRMSTSAQCCRN